MMKFSRMLAEYAKEGYVREDSGLHEWMEKHNVSLDKNYIGREIMSNEKKKVFISLNKAFIRENIETKDGEVFQSATLPKGVIIDGVDRGLYRFTAKYLYEDRYRPNNRLFQFPADYIIKLTLNQKNAEGKWEQADSIEVPAEKLKEAIMQQSREYLNSVKGSTAEKVKEAENAGSELEFEEEDLPFEEEPEL